MGLQSAVWTWLPICDLCGKQRALFSLQSSLLMPHVRPKTRSSCGLCHFCLQHFFPEPLKPLLLSSPKVNKQNSRRRKINHERMFHMAGLVSLCFLLRIQFPNDRIFFIFVLSPWEWSLCYPFDLSISSSPALAWRLLCLIPSDPMEGASFLEAPLLQLIL